MNRTTLHLICFTFAVMASRTNAQLHEWAYVLTDELTTIPFRFDHIESTQGAFGTDLHDLDTRFSPDTILAVWFDRTVVGGWLSNDKSVTATLTDGQRVRIVLKDHNDPDTIKGVRVDGGQEVLLQIDRIRSLSASYSILEHQDSDDDLILLMNNDLIYGFVLTVGPIVSIETDTGVQNFEMDQIQNIQIQNPPVYTPGIYVHTGYGECLAVDLFSAGEDRQLSIQPADPMYTGGGETRFVLDAGLEAIEYKRESLHLINPTLNDPISSLPTGGRHWVPKPELKHSTWAGTDRTTVFIPSPSATRWAIPHGSQRFSAWISTKNSPWTDNTTAVVAILDNGNEHILWSQHMTAQSPRHEVLVDLPDGSVALEIRTDPGNRGPIEDGVWIGSPRILVEGSPQFE
jgi:hypothetical protein